MPRGRQQRIDSSMSKSSNLPTTGLRKDVSPKFQHAKRASNACICYVLTEIRVGSAHAALQDCSSRCDALLTHTSCPPTCQQAALYINSVPHTQFQPDQCSNSTTGLQPQHTGSGSNIKELDKGCAIEKSPSVDELQNPLRWTALVWHGHQSIGAAHVAPFFRLQAQTRAGKPIAQPWNKMLLIFCHLIRYTSNCLHLCALWMMLKAVHQTSAREACRVLGRQMSPKQKLQRATGLREVQNAKLEQLGVSF